MNKLWSLLKWVLKAAIFFVLFAFALNNQHDIQVQLAFGRFWQAPVVLVILVTFALGLVVGALAMGWSLRHRRKQQPVSMAKSQQQHGV